MALVMLIGLAAPLYPVSFLSGFASAAPSQSHPVDKKPKCGKGQTPTQISKGKNKGKWYCKDSGGGGGGGSPGGGAGAQSPDTPIGGGKNCDSNTCDLIQLYVNPFVRLMSVIVGLVVAASLVMGGIQYSTSSGDPQKASAARGRISNALLALFAFAILYAFLNFIIPGGIFH